MTVNEMIQRLNAIKNLGGGEFTVRVCTGIKENVELDYRNIKDISAMFSASIPSLNLPDAVTIWSPNKED